MIANATGCSSIWGGSAPSTPYTINKDGRGPSWANSLFEDNAEYGFGMSVAVDKMRDRIMKVMTDALLTTNNEQLSTLFRDWIKFMNDADKSVEISNKLIPLLEQEVFT